ncbi:MAG: PEP/pyruvate-binding domain-containing protein, partial [Endomicrobiaceae bacterium]
MFFNDILENNALALEDLNSADSRAMYASIAFLEKMIEDLKQINEQHGNDADEALNEIKKMFDKKEMTSEFVKEQKSLSPWRESAIKDIRSLHTLINAVHQTAIADFTKIRDSMNKIDKSGMFIINPGKNQIPVYDFSEHKMKPEVRDFLSKLAEYKFGYYDDNKIMMKDGKLIWSKRLGVHSVDILINFDDINEGIRLSYYDSSRGDGGARRVSILAGVLSSIGFEITSFDNIVDKTGLENIGGVCGVKAVFRVENNLNVGESFAEAFYRVYRLMSRTKNLDYALEGKQDDDNDKGHIYGQYYVPSFTLDDFRRMKGNIKAVSAKIKDQTLNDELFGLYDSTRINREKRDGMDSVYDYLGLTGDKRNIDSLIRMFVNGKIVLNRDTNTLEINREYLPMQDIISAVKEDQNETFRQAQLINLINYGNMSFVSEGYIGKMIAVEGVLRLTDGYLSIKGVVDSDRKRMKCAYVEYVDFNGFRKSLKYNELINILNDNGYAVKHQKERSVSEKRETIKLLKEKITVKKQTVEINGRGVSSGNAGYSSGIVTYKKDNIEKDSILIMSYTTPDDIEQISRVKGLITTSGGMLSHANITAREQKKSAVLANGRWKGNNLECSYYTTHGDISTRNGFQIQEIEEHSVLLNEGDRIFINGETGEILLFNSINNRDLNVLQKEIDQNNTAWIKDFLDNHQNDKNIGMIVEYIYLQSVNNGQLDNIFTMLLSWDGNDVVRSKIKELNDKYIEDKLNAVNDALQNIKKIDDPNIAYSVIYRIEKQVNSIKSLSERDDIEKIKNEVKSLKKDIKDKLINFIASFKSTISYLNKKESLTDSEKENSVNLMEMAKVWNYFYGYPGIKEICRELESKIINDKNDGTVLESEVEKFENITAADALRYGTKTTELAKMSKLIKDKQFSGVNVPNGIGISKNVLYMFFEHIGKGSEFNGMMLSFEKAVLSGDKENARRIGKTISDMIRDNDSKNLEKYVKSLTVQGKMYAVRSSGVGEDGTSYAFAGMGETSLNVSFEDIYGNIKKSWKSFYSYRSIDYMTDSRHIVMPAVLVQEMVTDVSKAGVIFTRDENGNLTEEVVWGLGEGLVSGRINPDHIILNLKDNKITYLRALDNMKKIAGIDGGGTVQIRLSRDEQIERVIDESIIRKLSSAAFELEKNAGYPVDIEFAIDGNNQVYILQRRPITTLSVNESFAGIKEKNNAIDDKIIDKLISDLNGITKDRNLETIINVKNALSNLPENALEKYEAVSDQINILFDLIKADSSGSKRVYKNYFMQYLIPFIPFVNLRGTDETILNVILKSLPVDKENEYLDIVKVCGDIIKKIYPVSYGEAVGIIKFLQQKNIISYRNIPYSIKEALSDYKYEGLKAYYITVSEPGVDSELKNQLKNVSEKFRQMQFTDAAVSEKMESYLKEFDFLSDKINISTLPLLEYQLNSMINDLALNTSLTFEERTLILDGILSLCEQIISKNAAIDRNIIAKVNKIALESYNVTHNMQAFERIVSFLLFTAEQTDNIDRSETNGLAVEYLSKIALNIYEPVKKDLGDNKEYAEREKKCLDIFKRLSESAPKNMSIYRFLFNTNQYENAEGVNLSDKTFGILFNTVKKNNFSNIMIPVPYKDSDIIYSDKLASMFVRLSNNLNMVKTYNNLYESGENGKKIVLEVIKNLYGISKNAALSVQERKNAVLSLASLSSSSLYTKINDSKILDPEKINESMNALGISSFLKPAEAYISNISGNSRYSRDAVKDIYEFTALMKYLPAEILNGAEIVQKPPVYLKTNGLTNMLNEDVKNLVERFDTLQEILNYNVLALGMFDNLSQSMSEKDFNNIVDCVKKMIDGFIKINETHGNQAKNALNNILSSMGKVNDESIKKQMVISKWDFDTIEDIKEIHTLINAVHQTSIYDFKKSIGDVETANKHIKTITATQDNTSILAYDLSDKRLNKDIINLITVLATKKIPEPVGGSGKYKIEDFMCKDDILVWTTRLFVHSVDIFMNFGESDRGITIYYHEGGRNTGNAERVRYFKTILEKFGFNVDADMKIDYGSNSGVCGLKAVLNKDYGTDDTTDMVDIASKVILLFKYSNMLDWDLGELYDKYSYNSYLQTFDSLVEKFMDGEIWVGYAPTQTDCFGEQGQNMTKRIEKPGGNMVQFYNSVLSYLGLESIPSRERGYNIEQPKIDKYFNKAIERAYIEGRIVIDENGVLKKNEDYNIMSSVMTDIGNNISETSKQSRIVNLLNRYEFSFRTLGYVGSLIAVTGVMKLTNGEKLFVKGVMNPYTRRMKYAVVELVTETGHKKLTSDELISLLSEEGYDISNQEWVGNRERKMIKNLLERKIQVKDSPEVRCTSTSDGNGIYVAGNVTFDRKNVREDSILVVPYTTPDDVEAIKTSKGIITTGGGILSHAAITTREFKKPSVVINGAAWIDNEAEIQYFLSEGDVETLNGFQLQKVKSKNLLLKEGFRVVMNGETGTVLLFNDIDVNLLNELQDCIKKNDEQSVIDFMKKYEDNKDIRRLVEYVYFQSIGNSKLQQVLFSLFSDDMPSAVRMKIRELNQDYIKDKIRNITEGVENVKSIGNVNIAYDIIRMLGKKFDLIKTTEKIEDFEKLKEEIVSLQKEIKDRLFVYIKLLISDSRMYLEKEKLSIEDVRKIINIINTATVYDFFVPENEERSDLKDLSKELKQLLGLLEIKIKVYLTKDGIVRVNREIITFDEIHEEDVNKFGS